MFSNLDPTLGWVLYISPALVVFTAGLIVMITEAVARPSSKSGLLATSVVALLTAMALNAWISLGTPLDQSIFADMARVDRYGAAFQFIALLAGILTLFMSDAYLERIGVRVGEYYALVLFGVLGMMLLSIATDLIMVFIAVEVMSIAMYVLCAIKRHDPKCVEAGFKYFILGAFSSALLLYGIALLYGATGSTSLQRLASVLAAGEHGPLIAVGGALVIVGFGFKVAAAPFHMWAADVYQGAPTSVTALMATGVKAASFAAFGRVVLGAMGENSALWQDALVWMAALSMIVGNIAALAQDDLKRVFAYSSIAHAGYLMLALVGVGVGGVSAWPAVSSLVFYALAYTLMSAGAFAVLSLLVEGGEDATDISRLDGLGKSHPWLALGFTICLLSLAGIPPTMGFVGKFYLFAAAIRADHIGLAVVGMLSAAAGVYYYLRPILHMYFKDGHPTLPTDRGVASILGLVCIAMLLFGVMPSGLLQWASASMMSVVVR